LSRQFERGGRRADLVTTSMSLFLMSVTFAAMTVINFQALEALKNSNSLMRHFDNLSKFRALLRQEEYVDPVSGISYPATSREKYMGVHQRALVIDDTEYCLPVLGMRRRP